MKKILLCVIVTVFGLSNVFAQDFNVGISISMPISDANDRSNFSGIVEANYLWGISNKLGVGVTAGYFHFIGSKEDISTTILGLTTTSTIDYDDTSFAPVGVAVRLHLTERLTVGGDLGYALGISPDGNDGGIYYAPKLQFGVLNLINIVLAYRGININGGSENITVDGFTSTIENPDLNFSSVSLGIEFCF